MSDLKRLLAYDDWANAEALASLDRGTPPPETAVRLMSHVLATEAGWLRRMGAAAPFEGFWPEDDLAVLRAGRRDLLPPAWAAFLADPRVSDPARTIEYVNSRGERFTSAVGDVVMHVVLHSAYHRGQVASQVRAAGGTPANTDFIHATRTGLVP